MTKFWPADSFAYSFTIVFNEINEDLFDLVYGRPYKTVLTEHNAAMLSTCSGVYDWVDDE